MKIKLFFSAAIMAIAMTGCTSDDVLLTPETAEPPISFKAVTNNMTRAGYTFCHNDQPTHFYVGAFVGATNYFNSGNQLSWDKIIYETKDASMQWVNYNKDGDTEVTRTWPKYGTLNFYALLDGVKSLPDHGMVVTPSNDNNDVVVKQDYSINNNISAQGDLMYAITKGAKQSDNNGTVTLNFLHALSQICFEAKSEDPNNTFEITKITVSGVYNTGTFTLGNTSTAQGNANHDWTHTSLSDIVTPLNWWSGQDGSGTYEIDLDATLTSVFGEEANVNEYKCILNNRTTKNISNPNKATDNTDTYHSTYNDSYKLHKYRALNLMPQQTPSTAKITVDFNLNGKGGNSQDLLINGYNWIPGKRYIYTLTFTKGAEISYTTTIADFEDGSEINKDI